MPIDYDYILNILKNLKDKQYLRLGFWKNVI